MYKIVSTEKGTHYVLFQKHAIELAGFYIQMGYEVKVYKFKHLFDTVFHWSEDAVQTELFWDKLRKRKNELEEKGLMFLS
jgi:hypothetical protein